MNIFRSLRALLPLAPKSGGDDAPARLLVTSGYYWFWTRLAAGSVLYLGIGVGGLRLIWGLGFDLYWVQFVARYFNQGMTLSHLSHSAILGLLLVVIGFQMRGFTLLSEMVLHVSERPAS